MSAAFLCWDAPGDEADDVDHDAQAFHKAWSAQVDREIELADDPAWVEVPA